MYVLFSRRSFAKKSPLIFAIGLCWAGTAHGRSRGVSSVGCEGCHSGHDNSQLTVDPLVVAPGATTTLRFTLSDPDAKSAGIFIAVDDTTGMSVAEGSRLAVLENGITHTSPTNFSDGEVTYQVSWQVPNSEGATRFIVSSLTANDDDRSSGDEGLVENVDIVYGCSPETYFRDFDGDGFGRQASPLTHCAGTPPQGYAAHPGDCDDNTNTIYPGADEYCNRKDDDCDGEIDEDALPIELYPDADGDGYYSTAERQSGDMQLGCTPYPGYADQGGDCAPDNPDAHPGADEICDLYTDENCDGRVDERVRPICGVGWCRRESLTCDLAQCTPGTPIEETCNFMDDDCDDEIDEGDLCPAGQECLAGECRPAEVAPTAGAPSESDSAKQSSSKKTQGACAVAPKGALPPALLYLCLAAVACIRARQLRS